MDALRPLGGPVALLFACLASGLLVPLPEDVALLVAGWEARRGALDPGWAALAGIVGTLGRDAVAFGLGRLLGPRIERLPFVRRMIGERRLARAHASFAARGGRMLFWARFAVGLRTPLYFAAGSLGHPVRGFVLVDLAGLLLTVPLTLALGAALGSDAAETLVRALVHQRVALLVATVGGLGWLWWRRADRRSGGAA